MVKKLFVLPTIVLCCVTEITNRHMSSLPMNSLMPLNRPQISVLGKRITIKGYELVFTPASNRWIFTHLLSNQYNIKQGVYSKKIGEDIIHHIDFNKRNNNPGNLVRLNKMEHLFHHTRFLDKTLHSEESKINP